MKAREMMNQLEVILNFKTKPNLTNLTLGTTFLSQLVPYTYSEH